MEIHKICFHFCSCILIVWKLFVQINFTTVEFTYEFLKASICMLSLIQQHTNNFSFLLSFPYLIKNSSSTHSTRKKLSWFISMSKILSLQNKNNSKKIKTFGVFFFFILSSFSYPPSSPLLIKKGILI